MPSKTYKLVTEHNLEQSSIISDITVLATMWSCTLLPLIFIGVVGYLIAKSDNAQ